MISIMEVELNYKAWANAQFDMALNGFPMEGATELDRELIDSIDELTYCATSVRIDGQTFHVLTV